MTQERPRENDKVRATRSGMVGAISVIQMILAELYSTQDDRDADSYVPD